MHAKTIFLLFLLGGLISFVNSVNSFWQLPETQPAATGTHLPMQRNTMILTDFAQIAAGGDHTCAVDNNGTLYCWGNNYSGQIGDNTTAQRSTPTAVSGLGSAVMAVATGSYPYEGGHTCAIMTGGGVKCWGGNWLGQLGDGTTDSRSIPVNVIGVESDATALDAGYHHTCVLVNGTVKCWGANTYGQLGNGTTNNSSFPVNVVELSSATALATGWYHSCAVTNQGGVKCWGSNESGQLGDGTNINRTEPVDVVGLDGNAIALAAGAGHTCALMSGGGVKCWGNNGVGQLGDGTTISRTIAGDVIGLSGDATIIDSLGSHTCVLIVSGEIKCWGGNGSGQLGDGSIINRTVPVGVIGLSSDAIDIAVGSSHTCAVLTDQVSMCWGLNRHGQLGNGSLTQRSVSIDVVELENNLLSVVASKGSFWHQHTCALTSNGNIKCWGFNETGQLGDGSTTARATPVDVTDLDRSATAITVGNNHTCAVLVGDSAKCWGANWSGQLGDGSITSRNTPVDVIGLSNTTAALAAGDSHTCAIVTDGSVKCWGANWSGQLGDGTNVNREIPVDVVGLNDVVVALAAGSQHTCVLMSNGSVKCWGANWSGQLGDGTNVNREIPVDVVGLNDVVVALAAGLQHTCALMSDGGVKCWGANGSGQLGDGTTNNRNIPSDVVSLVSDINVLVAGDSHTCAIAEASGVRCWGRNYEGQLGDGTNVNRLTPVDGLGLENNVSDLAAGSGYTCTVSSGRIKCWGFDRAGQLGLGLEPYSTIPLSVERTAYTLQLSYLTGRAGSYFTLNGWNFPANTEVLLSINGHNLSSIQTTGTGEFVYFLATDQADSGVYQILAQPTGVSNSGRGSFIIYDDAPVRSQEGGGATISIPAGLAMPNWLVLVYMACDADAQLDMACQQAMTRLQQAAANPHINILALYDKPGANNGVRYHIQPNGSYQDGVNRWHLGELNTADSQTLADFITWGLDNYPAERTALVILGHGLGHTALAWDYTSGPDVYMRPAELRSALEQGTIMGSRSFDLVYYDACLMGLLEQAYQLDGLADVMVASENLIWLPFPYHQLQNLVGSDTDAHTLAEGMVAAYATHYSHRPHTISALDIAQVEPVAQAVDNLAQTLQTHLNTHQASISYSRLAAQKFLTNGYDTNTNDPSNAYLDLYDFAHRLDTFVAEPAVKTAATAVKNSIGQPGQGVVIAEAHNSGFYTGGGQSYYWDLENARGVAIYFPHTSGGPGYDDYISHQFQFTVDTRWNNFLVDYYGVLGTPPEPGGPPQPPPVLASDYRLFLPAVVR